MNIEDFFEFKVGEKVHDDLTGKTVEIIGISYQHGKKSVNDNGFALHTVGYWVSPEENPHCGGGRHPWELGKL